MGGVCMYGYMGTVWGIARQCQPITHAKHVDAMHMTKEVY